jgi:transglutaminase-like putative cysteine protease
LWVSLKIVCRALGIPARPVSNLVSAHDTNGTFTIDRFFDAKGNALESDPFNPGGETDSIWNFHVWVEAWMARADLPKGIARKNCIIENKTNNPVDDDSFRLWRLAGH